MATRTLDLTEQVNSVATTFFTPDEYLPGTLEVYLNGVRQRRGVFYAEAGGQVFTTSEAPRPGDSLQVQYEFAGPGDTLVFPTVVASGISPGRS